MKRIYGGSPLHMLGHVLVFALTGYAVAQIFVLDDTAGILLWLVAAVVLHDAVLWPLYSAVGVAGGRALGGAANYVRVPLGLSVLLAAAFLSTLTGEGEGTYSRASGREWDGYVARWLLVSAALFVVSAVVYLVRRQRAEP